MQAIRTVYLVPTNTHGARIKATCAAGSVTIEWDHRVDTAANHRQAAEALIAKLGWVDAAYGTLVTGTLADGSGVHVMTGRNEKEGVEL